jgi:hypothetical protein
MNLQDQRVNQIILQLFNVLQEGWGAYLVAKNIHEARSNKKIGSLYSFFNITERSCIESALLSVSKLVIAHGDSINIFYLLNYIEQNPETLSGTDKKTVLKKLIENREQLIEISTSIANVKEKRDHTLAHYDKKHITDPKAVYTFPLLTYTEIEKMFELVLKILNTYYGYLDPSGEFALHSEDLFISNDFSFLIKLIENGKKLTSLK